MASLHRMQDLGVDPRSVPQEHFSFPVPDTGPGRRPAERLPRSFFSPCASLAADPRRVPPGVFGVLHRTWVWTRGASPRSINILKNLVVDPRSVPP